MLFKKKTKEKPSETKAKILEKKIQKFVLKLEDKNILDEDLKNSIIELSNAENKEEIMKDLINKIEIHKDYDEESGVQFPWRGYVTFFMGEK